MQSKPSSPSPHTFRRFTIIPEAEKEGGYSDRCLELPGAISDGESLEELRANRIEAIWIINKY